MHYAFKSAVSESPLGLPCSTSLVGNHCEPTSQQQMMMNKMYPPTPVGNGSYSSIGICPTDSQRFSGYPTAAPYASDPLAYPPYSAMDPYLGAAKVRPSPYSINPDYSAAAYFSRVAGLHSRGHHPHLGFEYGSG